MPHFRRNTASTASLLRNAMKVDSQPKQKERGMRVNFDVHGSLVVEGETATEWLALKTWCERWSDNASPLVVKTCKASDKPNEWLVDDLRQLYRAPVRG